METKTCTKCGITKPVNCFGRNTRNKDKLHNHCKDCLREAYARTNVRYRAKQRERNPDYKPRTHVRKIPLLADGRSRWGCIPLPKALEPFFGKEVG